ncbi:uncharacterized protein LOC129589623 [Paramacrobiotus metropolitanus]|uniref:uncharacterized protein LOC129589623 n=1 Tax=Paramacrobiotus metropolitanus TaxID=2943436 RepID=UPI0024464FC0|nr:uncharacterized protein LOC129589623 [Paramacrobiotus metropolitanus]
MISVGLLFLFPGLVVLNVNGSPVCQNLNAICTIAAECCNGLRCDNGICSNDTAVIDNTISGGSLITRDQFERAVTTIGYWRYQPPTDEQYELIMRDAGPKGKITTKRELAMFLANVFHESEGMGATEERGPEGPYGPWVPYKKDPIHPERKYHGRGYLMLRGYPVYKEVSLGLYGDERLVENPDLVKDAPAAWDTAFWFWANKVHSQPGTQVGKLGVSAYIITGGRECQEYEELPERLDIYTKLLVIFGVNDTPDYSGCFDRSKNLPNNQSTAIITREQFQTAVNGIGYWYPPPTNDQYNTLMISAAPKASITTKRELAMFLANILHETSGLEKLDEYGPPYFPAATDPDHPERDYHGRGYMMLRGFPVYKEVSEGLYGDDRLVKNPDLVKNDTTVAWDTAFWFWAHKVHNEPGIGNGQFGVSTKIISNGQECNGTMSVAHALERFDIYKKVLQVLDPSEAAVEAGCYN